VTIIDLGIDQLVHYRLVDGRLIRAGATVVAAGTGPRHAVVPPSGRWYVAAELGSAVLALHRDTATGRLAQTAGPTAATAYDVDGNLPSAIVLAGDGRHLYVANRGANTIATFAIGDDGVPRMRGEVDCGGVVTASAHEPATPRAPDVGVPCLPEVGGQVDLLVPWCRHRHWGRDRACCTAWSSACAGR
jgi:hypothetical protein